MEIKRKPVPCPGCGRDMGIAKPLEISGLAKYRTEMFCPCGWSAGVVLGDTEEEAIDKAFEKARKRYKETYNPHLGE